jgi:hypothetical protein
VNRRYLYVGPQELSGLATSGVARARIVSADDVRGWVRDTQQALDAEDRVTATFIVAEDGWLWVADRRSEHVACARGGPVLSAGEITFAVDAEAVRVVEVSNQSTGFCPEPESWPAVAAALERAGLVAPAGFSLALPFRRCPRCGARNIVKDGWFECGVCGAELPREWNFG